MVQETFLPRIFLGKKKHLSPIVGALITMPAKKPGSVLMNLVTSSKKEYPSSQKASVDMIWADMGGGAFSNTGHLLELREERHDGQKTGMMRMPPHSRF